MRRSLLAALALFALLGASGCELVSGDPPATCHGMPACPAGTERVATCPDGGNCTRVTGCQTSICLVVADGGTPDTATADAGSDSE